MCLLAKVNDQEFWAFYLGDGQVELRDEKFQASPLPNTKSVLVRDELDPTGAWTEMPKSTLVNLARGRMKEALSGLKNLSNI